ncbi:MAG: hypothetical protein QOE90_1215 [Thermoplasmata archaeon]|jgi:uncharacterized tellurite resistance protein B-like protein|nr:hypothetical protein [Thermoplasmata archaeon]
MPLTEREGVAGIALLAMYADGVIMAEEDDLIRERLLQFPFFLELDEDALGRVLAAVEAHGEKVGPEKLLAESAAAVGPRLRPTAYLLATEVVMADGDYAPEEDEYLQKLRKALALSDEQARSIHEAVEIRARR